MFAGLIRILKYLAFLLAVFGPGLYVMAVAFCAGDHPHPAVDQARPGETSTPLPPMLEMLCVTLLLEIVREAGLRARSPSVTPSASWGRSSSARPPSVRVSSIPVLTMAAAATIATLASCRRCTSRRFCSALLLFCWPGASACRAGLRRADDFSHGLRRSEPFGYDYLYPLLPPTHASLRDGFVRSIWSRLAQRPGRCSAAMKRECPSLFAALLISLLVNVLLRSQTAYWPRAGLAAALVCVPIRPPPAGCSPDAGGLAADPCTN